MEKEDTATATVGKKDGYSLGVDAGGTAYTKQETGSGWTVVFRSVLNNLVLFFTKDPVAAVLMDVDSSAVDDAFNKVNADWATRIRTADKNATLELEAGPWRTINAAVGEAIAERTDVKVVFLTSEVEGGRLVIEAGTDVLGLMNGRSIITFADLAKKL